jgi:O-antigen/teichoic acid export membrane protein
MIWNWSGTVASMMVGFIIAPFLIHHLGQTVYGLWILIASFTSYFGLLDLGIRNALGRNVALHRAKADTTAVNATLSTSLAILCGAGLIALFCTMALIPLFGWLFDIPEGAEGEVRLALLLVGINLAMWVPLNVFDAALWGYQRFDILNAVDISMTLLRGMLTLYFVSNGCGLVALAVINLISMAGAQVVKAGFLFWIDRNIRLAWQSVERKWARELYTYGLWSFVRSVTRLMTNQLSPLIIGAILSLSLVAIYSVASRLIGYALTLAWACTDVLTPIATGLSATPNELKQQKMFLEGGKYCLVFALGILTGCSLLGGPLISLWISPEMEPAAVALTILALGELVPISQLTTQSLVLGMGKHRALAFLGIGETFTGVGLALILSRQFGLAGVCSSFALAAGGFRGLGQALFGCRLFKVSLKEYFACVVCPAFLVIIPPAVFLFWLTSWKTPTTWFLLIVYGLGYGIACGIACGFTLGVSHVRMGSAKVMRMILGTK